MQLKVLLSLLLLDGTLLLAANITEDIQSRIVGGKPTGVNKVPYIVNIRYNGTFTCAGTLISPRYVVTAAHCVVGKTTKRLQVVAGASKLSDKGKRSKVSRVSVPSKFNLKALVNDVAVLRLTKPLKGKNIGTLPLCNSTIKTGNVMQVSGWGYVSQNSGKPSNQLRTVQVPVIAKDKCVKDYSNRILSNTMFCAAKPGKRDACTGDSGGPAVYKGQLCGIVSFGVGCADAKFPGVYTNVNAVRAFIKSASKK